MIEINQQQVRDILQKINPAHINDAIKQLLKRMGGRGRVLSQNYLKPTDSARSTNYAPKSMRYDVKDMTATVFSVMPQARAQSIEEGRPPGQNVGLKAIARWHDGNLYLHNSTLNRMTDSEKATLFRIKAAIKRSGASGKHFISKSYNKLRDDLPDELKKIAASIEKRWAK